MSFASVQGNSIGKQLNFFFSGDDTGIAVGTPKVVLSDVVISPGAYVFCLNFSIYTGTQFSQFNKMCAKIVMLYGESVIAQQRMDGQEYEDVCISGLFFSDGTKSLELIIEGLDAQHDETASVWGYTDGNISMVRLTDSILK
jgi:hypothetical protein